ncbi:MAG: alpha-glucan family phosphorylase [Deltaproteobacteria bacterium]|nr:alpha-glucan family phosphorylase [Deltaproteobacteria bacterium]
MKFVFEVSWEVCNKVGGIHTVITSKATHAVREYGDNYYLLGPLLDHNTDFEETDDAGYGPIRAELEKKGLSCRLGRWQIPGRPRVVLVDFRNRYDVSKLLYDYWQQSGVNSYSGGYDYVEPVVFSTACGEVVEAIHRAVVTENDGAVAHFHEWMCGAGLLHLKHKLPEIGTVFTTHATILGRSMAGSGVDIYAQKAGINPEEDAKAYGVAAKHSMEAASAREADCFTTVSGVTADEAAVVLGKAPDRIVFNGLDIGGIPDYAVSREGPARHRRFLLNLARKFLQKDLPDSTRFWIISGRYEFHNKGFDVLLQSLAHLDEALRARPGEPIVAWFMVAAGHKGVPEDVRRRLEGAAHVETAPAGIATHRLYDEQHDPILNTCYRLALKNGHDNPVNVIFSPAYIDGHDGIFNLAYYDLLSACDLGVFPSYYEPWGYTPLESIGSAVPTITTDLAGFGRWVQDLAEEPGRGVSVIARRGRPDDEVVRELDGLLGEFASMGEARLMDLRREARRVAAEADWAVFFKGYVAAYEEAIDKASQRVNTLDTSAFSEKLFSPFKSPQSATPHYRAFTVVTTLPAGIERLRDLAYNMWWTWHPDAEALFLEIDPALWEESNHNPVKLLNRVSYQTLRRKEDDKNFKKKYERVLGEFDAYMGDATFGLAASDALCGAHPAAYFSMEFCLHESLPIYSGGLGVLAGDHLKSASDLSIPLVGVGLLYKQGYFEQRIDRDGHQLETYPFLDYSEMPVKAVLDAKGNEVRVSVQLPGRTLTARVWRVDVGRVRLYLLDSDVEENTPEDRRITWQLYGGDKELRLKQELLLGIGGVRVLRNGLGLLPSVYHLNEGHCGFLLLERIRRLMSHNLTFQEAREAVKASTVFTTHTPVPAGNETFEGKLMEYFFRDMVAELGVSFEQFMELGRDRPSEDHEPFSMTVLALKLSSKANAVSKLHGKVCREMWKDVWKGVSVEEVPISSITNGIHVTSWMGRNMRRLFAQYLDMAWDKNHDDPDAWQRVADIPDVMLWGEHMAQKRFMIEEVKKRIFRDYARRGEDPEVIRETIDRLTADRLTLGFARRFASYKRGHLLFKDKDALARLVGSEERPVQLIFAGKAHPADKIGKDIIKGIVESARSPEFRGRIVYLENYDMALGRLLTQGVDVWLNTPVRPYEASGTSGMKVAPNGGLNCSILDGWWDEGYKPGAGWAIDAGPTYANRDHQDELDRMALIDILEKQIIPLYYDRGDKNFSAGWTEMMKESVRTICPRFNTMRMLKEYYALLYQPAAERGRTLFDGDFTGIRKLTTWKRKVTARFSTVHIQKLNIKGVKGDILPSSGGLELELLVDPGKMGEAELEAELVIGLRAGDTFSDTPTVVRFKRAGRANGIVRFELSYNVELSGNYFYAVRVVPVHELLSCTAETGLACWG